MKFEVTDVINQPIDKVFPIMRDKMDELVEYLPNVESIVYRERRPEGNDLHATSHWQSKINLPGPAGKLIPEKDRGWEDIAVWHNDRHSVDWKFVIGAFPEAIKVHGTNTFTAEGQTTRLTISGNYEIDYRRIPGVPNFLLKKIVPVIEKIAFAAVKPNMLKVNRGVEQLLAKRK